MAGFDPVRFFRVTRDLIVNDLLDKCQKDEKFLHPWFYGEKWLDLAKAGRVDDGKVLLDATAAKIIEALYKEGRPYAESLAASSILAQAARKSGSVSSTHKAVYLRVQNYCSENYEKEQEEKALEASAEYKPEDGGASATMVGQSLATVLEVGEGAGAGSAAASAPSAAMSDPALGAPPSPDGSVGDAATAEATAEPATAPVPAAASVTMILLPDGKEVSAKVARLKWMTMDTNTETKAAEEAGAGGAGVLEVDVAGASPAAP